MTHRCRRIHGQALPRPASAPRLSILSAVPRPHLRRTCRCGAGHCPLRALKALSDNMSDAARPIRRPLRPSRGPICDFGVGAIGDTASNNLQSYHMRTKALRTAHLTARSPEHPTPKSHIGHDIPPPPVFTAKNKAAHPTGCAALHSQSAVCRITWPDAWRRSARSRRRRRRSRRRRTGSSRSPSRSCPKR